MKSFAHNHDRLKEALRRAYHAREQAPIEGDELWRMKVMSHIRRLEPSDGRTIAAALFTHYLWRLTPVVCVLIIMLSLAVMAVDFSLEYEVMQFFINDPVEFTVAQQMW